MITMTVLSKDYCSRDKHCSFFCFAPFPSFQFGLKRNSPEGKRVIYYGYAQVSHCETLGRADVTMVFRQDPLLCLFRPETYSNHWPFTSIVVVTTNTI
jgi:hypothetical protein